MAASLDRLCPCGECGIDPARWTPECREEAGLDPAPPHPLTAGIQPDLIPGTYPAGRLFPE